jgi:hypothetical protein
MSQLDDEDLDGLASAMAEMLERSLSEMNEMDMGASTFLDIADERRLERALKSAIRANVKEVRRW